MSTPIYRTEFCAFWFIRCVSIISVAWWGVSDHPVIPGVLTSEQAMITSEIDAAARRKSLPTTGSRSTRRHKKSTHRRVKLSSPDLRTTACEHTSKARVWRTLTWAPATSASDVVVCGRITTWRRAPSCEHSCTSWSPASVPAVATPWWRAVVVVHMQERLLSKDKLHRQRRRQYHGTTTTSLYVGGRGSRQIVTDSLGRER